MALSPLMAQVTIFILAALSIGSMLAAVFYSRLGGPSRSEKRIEVIARARNPAERRAATDETKRKRSVEDTLRQIEEQQKARARKGAKPPLALRMRQAGLSWTLRTFWAACAASGAALSVLLVGGGAMGPVPALFLGMGGGVLLPYAYVNVRRNRRFKNFTEEFPNAVDVIVRGVKAGLPVVDCLKIIAAEAQEPVKSEFQQIIEDQTLGLPLDEAVARLPERIPLSEANFFAIVIAMQARSGGSLSEALGNLSKVLRDRKKMRAKIKAMSQEAKSSAGIIGALPVVVTILIYLTSPDYIMLLFTTGTGKIVLVASGLWMLMGILVMRKMINFDF